MQENTGSCLACSDMFVYVHTYIKVILFLIWSQNPMIGQNSEGMKTQYTVELVCRPPSQSLISLFGYKMF